MKRTYLLLTLLTFCSYETARGENYMPTAEEVIKKLNLKPLPEEGGYYRETYRSNDKGLPTSLVGIDKPGKRNIATAIYYLVDEESFSALHKIKSDEIFHFYAGDTVEMFQIDTNGKGRIIELGSNFMDGQEPQVLVTRGHWQGLRLKKGGRWALLGTTVSPGFEFEDFEVGKRDSLLKAFPQHTDHIMRFTRE